MQVNAYLPISSRENRRIDGNLSNAHESSENALDDEDVQELPAPDIPLRKLVELLLDKAAAGNKAAAERLHKDFMRCRSYLIRRSITKGQLSATDAVSQVKIADASKADELLGQLGRKLDRDAKLCASIDDNFIERNAYNVLLYSARSGNEDAASCFVSGELFPRYADIGFQERDLQAKYRDPALEFVASGIRDGDWRMVNLMILAYGGYSDPGSFLSSLVRRDSVALFAWIKLAQLGAGESDSRALEARLNHIIRDRSLSVVQIHKAETWANTMFTNFFIDQPPFTSETTGICGETQ